MRATVLLLFAACGHEVSASDLATAWAEDVAALKAVGAPAVPQAELVLANLPTNIDGRWDADHHWLLVSHVLSDCTDAVTVIMHELGHAYGLKHEPGDPRRLMYPNCHFIAPADGAKQIKELLGEVK